MTQVSASMGWSAEADRLCRQVIAHGSKSFAAASRLLPAASRHHAVVLYTWCRRADDAVDQSTGDGQLLALARLRQELDRVYSDTLDADADLALRALQATVRACGIPKAYPEALLAGMAMDAEGRPYQTMDDLYLYCYRVAGVVGLMMCHILGIANAVARRHAVHMGMAMQLTNICRDVAEDWRLGRLYLPQDLLPEALAGVEPHAGEGGPEMAQADLLRPVVRQLLAVAARFYASGDQGCQYLPWRAALAIHAARLIYADIGRVIAAHDFDILAPRAVVSGWRKLWLIGKSLAGAVIAGPGRWARTFAPASLPLLRYPDEVLPL